MKVLHVGCGSKSCSSLPQPFSGSDWIETRLDIDSRNEPDIVADMCDMSVLESGSFDGLWSAHNVEHLFWHDLPRALKEFHRVLKPNGLCAIQVPDLQRAAEFIARGEIYAVLYSVDGIDVTPFDLLYGHRAYLQSGNMYMMHKCGFTAASLASALLAFDFSNIRILRIGCDLIATCIASASTHDVDTSFNLVDYGLAGVFQS